MAKVLLVEDDNNLREIYQARLQAEGYDIVSASDGEEALVVAKQEKPDLVISDVMMPKISGFEMLDILRNTDGLKDVKVIMLTALGQSDDQQRADKLGADRYLVKSQVTLEDIVKVAHHLLEGDTAAPAESVAAGASSDATAPADPVATPPPAADPVTPSPTAPDPAPAVTPDPVAAATAPATPPTDPVTPPAEPAAAPATPFAPVEVPHEAPAEPAEPATTASEPDVAAATNAVASDNPETTAQEEAEVEAKIEDFVAGASTEATAPAEATPEPEASADPATTATPETPAEPVVNPVSEAPAAAPELAPTTPEAQAHDDKVMADAVQNLATPAALPDAPEAAPVAEQPSTAPSAPPSAAAPVSPSATVTPTTETADNDAVTVAHKKIIQPIDSAAKPDITSLAAAEEAKEAAAAPPPAPIVITSDQPAAPADPSKPNPNDIAL